MARGEDTRDHPNRKVGLYAYRDSFNASLRQHMAGDSSSYEELLKNEGFVTPSGKDTGAGRVNPLARNSKNWDM